LEEVEEEMATGWMLVAGLAAMFMAVSLAAVVLRVRGRTTTATDGWLGLGPALVALGIVFGDDRLVGYALMGAGVLLSVVLAIQRRSTARG
jgi:hypothetical protein